MSAQRSFGLHRGSLLHRLQGQDVQQPELQLRRLVGRPASQSWVELRAVRRDEHHKVAAGRVGRGVQQRRHGNQQDRQLCLCVQCQMGRSRPRQDLGRHHLSGQQERDVVLRNPHRSRAARHRRGLQRWRWAAVLQLRQSSCTDRPDGMDDGQPVRQRYQE